MFLLFSFRVLNEQSLSRSQLLRLINKKNRFIKEKWLIFPPKSFTESIITRVRTLVDFLHVAVPILRNAFF